MNIGNNKNTRTYEECEIFWQWTGKFSCDTSLLFCPYLINYFDRKNSWWFELLKEVLYSDLLFLLVIWRILFDQDLRYCRHQWLIRELVLLTIHVCLKKIRRILHWLVRDSFKPSSTASISIVACSDACSRTILLFMINSSSSITWERWWRCCSICVF